MAHARSKRVERSAAGVSANVRGDEREHLLRP